MLNKATVKSMNSWLSLVSTGQSVVDVPHSVHCSKFSVWKIAHTKPKLCCESQFWMGALWWCRDYVLNSSAVTTSLKIKESSNWMSIKEKGYDSSHMKEIILGQGSELIDVGVSSTLHADVPIMRHEMDWIVSSWISYTEALTPNVRVFGNEAWSLMMRLVPI